MKNVLITGATGNVGIEVIKALQKISHDLNVCAGVRNLEKNEQLFKDYAVKLIKFDFTDFSTFENALQSCEILFLLRPPQISNTEKYFKPLIEVAKAKKIKHIIFISVQGAEKNSFIPHHKIEKLISESGIPYTFLRPAYFMQNFLTTLHQDLLKKYIFLPSGNAKFTVIDVRDIAKVTVKILLDVPNHLFKCYELTNNEQLSFQEMADILSEVLEEEITYKSPNLLKFIYQKRKEGQPFVYIFVLIFLHYFPRFQKPPQNSNWVQNITGIEPTEFKQFVKDFRVKLLKP